MKLKCLWYTVVIANCVHKQRHDITQPLLNAWLVTQWETCTATSMALCSTLQQTRASKTFTGKQSYTHAWLVLGLLIKFIHELSGDYFEYSGNQEVISLLMAHTIKVWWIYVRWLCSCFHASPPNIPDSFLLSFSALLWDWGKKTKYFSLQNETPTSKLRH